jgi:hypothetical protein
MRPCRRFDEAVAIDYLKGLAQLVKKVECAVVIYGFADILKAPDQFFFLDKHPHFAELRLVVGVRLNMRQVFMVRQHNSLLSDVTHRHCPIHHGHVLHSIAATDFRKLLGGELIIFRLTDFQNAAASNQCVAILVG